VQNRNGLILNGGDCVWRLSLFWGQFLPLGRVLSVDSALVLPHSSSVLQTDISSSASSSASPSSSWSSHGNKLEWNYWKSKLQKRVKIDKKLNPEFESPSTTSSSPHPLKHQHHYQQQDTVVFGFHSAAFMLQFMYIYWFTYGLKTGIAWHDGSAVYYALQLVHNLLTHLFIS
jgi:hypothetical protein